MAPAPQPMEKEMQQDRDPGSGPGEKEVTWRDTLGDATENAQCQLLLMALLMVDICVIAMEFLLKGTSCGGTDSTMSGGQINTQHTLHTISVSILLIFAFHLVLQMVAFGMEFWKDAHYLIDVAVIFSALVFEMGNFKAGEWITILLLSRVVRVVHAIKQTHVLQQASAGKKVDAALAKRDVEDGAFEVENTLSTLQEPDSPGKSGNAASAELAKVAAAKIMADDEEYTAGLDVPADIAAIDDVAKLRLLLAEERRFREQFAR